MPRPVPQHDPKAQPPLPRILAIDTARGIAVMLMVFIHAHFIYAKEATREGLWGSLCRFIGQGACVFLVAMGASLALSREKTLAQSFQRSILLFCLGCVLNFVWLVVPFVLGFLPAAYAASNEWTRPSTDITQMLQIVFTGDILHLAAFGLFLAALARRSLPLPAVHFAIALLITILSGPLRDGRPGILGLDRLASYFFTNDYSSFFPVFPWSAGLFVGTGIGLLLRKKDGDMGAVLRPVLFGGLLSALVGQALMRGDHNYHFGDFFHMGPGGTLWLIGWACGALGLAHFLSRWSHTAWGRLTFVCSKRVTSIYALHLLILLWGMSIIGYKSSGPIGVVLSGGVALALSLGIDECSRRLFRYLKPVASSFDLQSATSPRHPNAPLRAWGRHFTRLFSR